MENNNLTTEIKSLTDLLRNSSSEKRGEIEGHLIVLYKLFFKGDEELLKGSKKIDEKINEITTGKPTNWSLKVQALERLKNEQEPVVTLLDGTQVRKSQVPAGEIYINENGQKVRKVLKVVPVPPKPEEKKKPFAKLSQKLGEGLSKAKESVSAAVVNGSSQLIKVSKNTFGKIGEKKRRAKASAYAFMDVVVANLMNKMRIGDTITSLEEYQKKTGKDVSDLINFLKKLQTVG